MLAFYGKADGPSSRKDSYLQGASGNSVGLRVKVKSAEMEEDGGLEVLTVAIPAR
jgi:hypothetical protein